MVPATASVHSSEYRIRRGERSVRQRRLRGVRAARPGQRGGLAKSVLAELHRCRRIHDDVDVETLKALPTKPRTGSTQPTGPHEVGGHHDLPGDDPQGAPGRPAIVRSDPADDVHTRERFEDRLGVVAPLVGVKFWIVPN